MIVEALAVAAVGAGGYAAARKMSNKNAEIDVVPTAPQQTEEEKSSNVLSRAGGWIGNKTSVLRNKITGDDKVSQLAKDFQAWAATTLTTEKPLQLWIASLSDEGIKVLTEQLSDFCYSVNMDLAWLVHNRLDKDPDLKAMAQDVVVGYCTACWKAAEAQERLKVFQTFVSLEENPTSKENKQISRDVFSEMVKRGITEQAPPELFLASEKERQEHMNKAIMDVANNNRPVFNEVIKSVVIEGQTEKESESTPSNKSESTPKPEPVSASA